MKRRLVLIGAALSLAGCATRPLHETLGDPVLARAAIVKSADEDGRPIAETLVRQLGNRHDVLLLSGGGSDGAFGAGVLVGWTASGTRPSFDVVTGVSTGALMATLAFLGPAHDADLVKAYTGVTNKDIYRKRGLVGLARNAALYDRTPLENTIAGVVDEKLLDEVAAEYKKGRRLYVASTDLDAGLTTVWDMGRIAASTSPQRVTLYRQVLAASAAIPGAFEPVYIKQGEPQPTMHVDGGVKTAIIFRSYMIDTRGSNENLWTIVNGHISYRGAKELSGANAPTIVGRSISELMRTVTQRSVQRAYMMARNARAKFNLAFLPDEIEETNPIDFNPPDMKRLFDYGVAFGRAGKWLGQPPRLETLEKMP